MRSLSVKDGFMICLPLSTVVSKEEVDFGKNFYFMSLKSDFLVPVNDDDILYERKSQDHLQHPPNPLWGKHHGTVILGMTNPIGLGTAK